MDIVERLRAIPTYADFNAPQIIEHEAADEIEWLRKRIEVLQMDYNQSVQEGINLAMGWKCANSLVKDYEFILERMANADMLTEDGKPLAGGYFILLARAALDMPVKVKEGE